MGVFESIQTVATSFREADRIVGGGATPAA
jgi:hypothetical protein